MTWYTRHVSENPGSKLKDMYAKRDEMKKKELLKAVETSSRSYEEIMAFLAGKDGQEK